MFKRSIMLLCFLLILPMVAYAENTSITSLEAPKSFNVRESDHPSTLLLRFTTPNSVANLMSNEDEWILIEFDWKINDAPWKFNKSWGSFTTENIWQYYEDESVIAYVNNISQDEDNARTIFYNSSELGHEFYDLKNNTYYFRIRYVYEYDFQDPTSGEWGYKHVVSPYLETSIGKLGSRQLPTSLDAPRNLTAELRRQTSGQPYFHFQWEATEGVKAANQLTDVKSFIDWKVGDGKWASESGELMFSDNKFAYSMDVDPIDKGAWGGINIEANTYHFRSRYEFEKPDGSTVRSPFSNVVTIGTPAFYSGASEWAKPELQKASDAGLIPQILVGVDMTKPITREEFAELAVLLYEKTTGKTAESEGVNPFKDTNNPQILKAYKLGITQGTSATAFSPKVLINREQCATMLFRTIKAIDPQGNYSIEGVKDFADQRHISGYAVEGTKYMFKLGIIKGDNNGNFMPKATTTAQEATGYGAATREAAILMSVRTYEVQKSGGNN